jgi:hypothetical protein
MDTPTSPLAVDTTFDTIQSLRDTCAAYAIDNAFEYKVISSSQNRYTIRCKAEGCSWRLHGSTVKGSSFCHVRTYNNEHTCFGLNHVGHAQASSGFIAKQIAEKLKDQSKYRPVDIIKDVHRELGVKIGYTKAWNAKERANELNNGTHNAAYQALPKYCADIVASNPNSVAFVEKTPDDKFKRLFICYGACALGFAYCRPVLGLDGTHLKTTFQGTPFYNCFCLIEGILLTATGVDANGSLFPLAYAVVNAENDENWLWFLHHLRTVLDEQTTHLLLDDPVDSIVLLSDRQKGLVEGVERLFPESPHGFCLRHLQENMHKKFPHSDLINLLWAAARATTEADFKKSMADIKAISPACVEWLNDKSRDPKHWADLYFPGRRYGHLTSNIAEALNAKLLAAREMPILAMLEEIRQQVMGWFASRRLSEVETPGGIVSGVAAKIQTLISGRARRYRYLQSTKTQFEVKSKETLSEYLVNLDVQTCSCREWQTTVHPSTNLAIFNFKGISMRPCTCRPSRTTETNQRLRQVLLHG